MFYPKALPMIKSCTTQRIANKKEVRDEAFRSGKAQVDVASPVLAVINLDRMLCIFSRLKSAMSHVLIALISWTGPAHAYNNSSGEILVGLVGMLAICGLAIFAAQQAETGANDPDSSSFANQDNFSQKLSQHLSNGVLYRVDVFRQSGNLERSIGPLDKDGVTRQILSTMKRARIDVVSISRSDSIVTVGRSVHNGRGRQEGKRIGSFDIVPV